MTMTLAELERLAQQYAEARSDLADRVQEVEEAMVAIKRQRLPLIRRALAVAQERREQLAAAIAAAPQLFERPKTIVCHGLRIGYQKGRGSLTWDDDARVCTLIRRYLPDQADLLIHVTERPDKRALAQLDAAMLRRIGVQLVDVGEQVIIRPLDGELDRLVERLLAVEPSREDQYARSEARD
jgi:arsenate reductase-like glutaredoxin family protein